MRVWLTSVPAATYATLCGVHLCDLVEWFCWPSLPCAHAGLVVSAAAHATSAILRAIIGLSLVGGTERVCALFFANTGNARRMRRLAASRSAGRRARRIAGASATVRRYIGA